MDFLPIPHKEIDFTFGSGNVKALFPKLQDAKNFYLGALHEDPYKAFKILEFIKESNDKGIIVENWVPYEGIDKADALQHIQEVLRHAEVPWNDRLLTTFYLTLKWFKSVKA